MTDQAKKPNGSTPDLSDALTSGEYKRVPTEWTKLHGYFPNELRESDDGQTLLLIAKADAAPDRDFAVSAKALTSLVSNIEAGHITEAYIVFVERHESGEKVFGARDAKEILALVRDRLKVKGRLGDYWWVSREIASPNGDYEPRALQPM